MHDYAQPRNGLRAAYAPFLPIPFPPAQDFPSVDEWDRLADVDYELAGWVTRVLAGERAQRELYATGSAEVEAIANVVSGSAVAYCEQMLRLLEAVRPLLSDA